MITFESDYVEGCHEAILERFKETNYEQLSGYGNDHYTVSAKEKIKKACNNDNVEGLSILGGEPMHPSNIEGTTKLAKAFKDRFPNKSLWVWTGFTFDNYLKNKEVSQYIDVLIDGQYVDELHDPTLKWKGSSNQRVIDVQKSLKENKIITIE